MFEWLNTHIEQAKEEVDQMLNINSKESTNKKSNQKETEEQFKLPIYYLTKDRYELPETVSNDLEMYKGANESSVYDIVFQPSHNFAKNQLKKWNKYYTTNTQFLKETQDVIEESFTSEVNMEYDTLMEMWKDTKGNPSYFLEKYGYVEWSFLKSFNNSSTFLQIISIVNMSSPIIGILLPFFFLLIPFLILKIKNVPISFPEYIQVLKSISQNHFIGKLLSCITDFSFQNLFYVCAFGGLFLYQTYNNVISCIHFYKNIHKVNNYLCKLKSYLYQSINNMNKFISLHSSKPNYAVFCSNMEENKKPLVSFLEILMPIEKVDNFIFKLGSIGYMLKCYYFLHENKALEDGIQYSFGFEGYLNNLSGLRKHCLEKSMNMVKFNKKKTAFHQQYYPFHWKQDKCIKNNVKSLKKMIVTGPNASGKTTFLKTNTINIILCQQLGMGFFEQANIYPYSHLHSYLNIPDTSGRDSLFQAESRRCKEIITIINKFSQKEGYRHYCIFDELYSGTNPKEASKSALAFLKYLNKFGNVNYILTTHYVNVCQDLNKFKSITNCKMDVQKKDGKLNYNYKLKKGISEIEGAISILEEMEYPDEIIKSFKEKEKEKTK